MAIEINSNYKSSHVPWVVDDKKDNQLWYKMDKTCKALVEQLVRKVSGHLVMETWSLVDKNWKSIFQLKKKKEKAKFIITNMAELQTLQEDNLQEGAQFSQFQNKRQTKIWFYQVSW